MNNNYNLIAGVIEAAGHEMGEVDKRLGIVAPEQLIMTMMMMMMVMMVITYLNSARTTTGRVARDVKVTRRVHVRSCKGNYFPRL